MDFENAKSKTKAAGWTGLVIAGLTSLVVIGSMASGSEELSYFADPWIFADVILLALLSVGVLLHSRVAAILLVLFYLAGRILMFVEFGEAKGVIATVLISAVFARGIQGAFVYHRLRSAPSPYGARSGPIALQNVYGEPDAQPQPQVQAQSQAQPQMQSAARPSTAEKEGPTFASKLGGGALKVAGGVLAAAAGIALFLFLTWGTAVGLKIIPGTSVIEGDEMRGWVESSLRKYGALEDEETVQFYYSGGFLSYMDEGVFFTEDRVVAYANLDGPKPTIHSAHFSEIVDLQVTYSEFFGEPTRITVFPDRGKNFKLRVPQNGDQDQEFFETLQQRWKESKSGFDAIFSGS